MREMCKNVLVLACTCALVVGWTTRAKAAECDAGTKLAETCDGAMTYAGCCAGAKLIWCGNAEGDTGPLCGINCGNNQQAAGKICGWADTGYDCGGDGADPAGTNPLECSNWNCTPSCGAKVCGDDGCLGSCGTCDADQYCDTTGACQACTCAGKECGADECGKACGTCTGALGCDKTGKCVAVPTECVTKDTAGCPGCACESCVCNGNGGSFAGDADCCATDSQYGWDGYCANECQVNCGGPECPCVSDCAGKTCGDDGCGGTCGTCTGAGEVCTTAGACCVPNCTDKSCGDDGCGGTCGACADTEYCTDAGVCATCSCGDQDCGYDKCDNACGANDGACAASQYCDATSHCQTCSCTGRECGGDGCGNGCGICATGKGCSTDGKCVDAPLGCASPAGAKGCGGAACACEACVCDLDDYCCTDSWDSVCADSCAADCGTACPCVQQCDGLSCGNDGCGGTCGTCTAGNFCNAGTCAACTCEGKQCGDDGCGKDCGACPAGKLCGQDNQCADDPCHGVPEAGCCSGTLLKYCDTSTGTSVLKAGDCGTLSTPTTCGWDASSDWYDCGFTGGDPSGAIPLECPACTGDCKNKVCGDDGCGISCGTCGAGQVCDTGACVADQCNGVTAEGCCDALVNTWCEGGVLKTDDCSGYAAPQNTCGWYTPDGYAPGYYCGGNGGDPAGVFPLNCADVKPPEGVIADQPVEHEGDIATSDAVTPVEGEGDAATTHDGISIEGTVGKDAVAQNDGTTVVPEGTTDSGSSGGCNAGAGASAVPFALLLSSFGAAILRRRRS